MRSEIAPMKPKIPKKSISKEKKKCLDPRFFNQANIYNHLQSYSFLYNDEIRQKINTMKRRRHLEDFFVKKGKKRYFLQGGNKQLKKMMKNGKKE